VGRGFELGYLKASVSNFVILVLAIYINVFGAIFEMYNLQVASNEFEILKKITYRFYYCFGVFIDTVFPHCR
jgi:hypothetical protein